MALFISFEGDEYVGKTAQATILVARLKSQGVKTLFVREPGGTPFGEACRILLKDKELDICPEAELLLMNASRAQLVNRVILPALQQNVTVVADRFSDSTIAYQGYGRQLGKKANDVVDVAVGNVMPDVTFYLWATKEVKKQRRILRGIDHNDKFEAENGEFFKRVNEGYEHIMTHNTRVACIESGGDIHQIGEAIWQKLMSWKMWCGRDTYGPVRPWAASLDFEPVFKSNE